MVCHLSTEGLNCSITEDIVCRGSIEQEALEGRAGGTPRDFRCRGSWGSIHENVVVCEPG